MMPLKLIAQTLILGLLLFANCTWADVPVAEIPVKTGDFNTILAAKSSELTVWQYAGNNEIYIFDFPNLTLQGKTFNRITQLSEQADGTYKHVLTREQMEQYLVSKQRTQADLAFGHDLPVSKLVLFFNLAESDKEELSPEEQTLLNFTISHGLIKEWRKFYQASKPNVVVLSVAQTQDKKANEPRVSESVRRTVLMHELSHGEFFSNPYYAKYCADYWSNVMTDEQRESFKKFLAKDNYSINNFDLMVNETQAYLMFTPDPGSFSAEKLGVTEQDLEAMRSAFYKEMPNTSLPVNYLGLKEKK